METHEALAPLSFLLGTWRGGGTGEYPTIASFSYEEEVTFSHSGKPFLIYGQRTWDPGTRAPLHAESGYWRPGAGGHLEVILAHPFGAAEVLEGSVEGRTIRMASLPIVTTSGAKQIDATERDVTVDGDVLRYSFRMAAVGHPMTHHLSAELRRVG
jgi:hypothetical protein